MLRGLPRTFYRAKSTYISKHFTISPSDLSKVVGLNGYFKDYRLKQSGEMDIRTCFDDCARGNKGVSDNAWKLMIRRDGSYYCYRCGAKGNWYNLKQRLTGVKHADITDSVSTVSPQSMYSSDSGSGRSLNEMQIHQSNSNNGTTRNNNTKAVGNKSNNAILPDQREAFGYHLNLTAAMYSKEENPKSLEMLREEVKTLEDDASAQNIPVKVPSSLARPLVLQYLQEERGLNDQVVVRYGVGCAIHSFPIYKEEDAETRKTNNGRQIPQWTEKVCITFPWFEHKSATASATSVENDTILKNNKGEDSTKISTSVVTKRSVAYFRPHGDTESTYFIKRLKLRAIDTKGMQRTLPKGGAWGFFGWHLVQPQHKTIIITEGEYDAMAVSQGLAHLPSTHELYNVPAISLPNGCNSLPPELIPSLEQFQRIYLWMDNDKPGQEASEKFAYKLGIHRCRIVSPIEGMKNPPKDANDALRQSHQVGSLKSPSSSESTDLELIPNMILSAKALNHQRLESFKSLRGEILSNIRQPENVLSGAAITSLPRLSQTIKGLRKGELVILTGPTGCGKTTLLSQISLDLARQGAPVLWGSFEIRNAMLIEKMLRQFGGMNIKTMDHEKLERLADDFETLPLKFMNFHAGSDMSQVLEAMDFAVYRDDVQHIIIDNLQFMMPRTAIPGITGSQNMNHSCKSLQPNSIFTLISIASANLFQLTLCQSDFPFIL